MLDDTSHLGSIVKFTQMKDGTREDYELLERHERDYLRMLPDRIMRAREALQMVPVDDGGAMHGQPAFRQLGKAAVELVGDDELQHGVAQELEALIIEMMALRFVPETGMGQCLSQQQGIAKFVADPVFQGGHRQAKG